MVDHGGDLIFVPLYMLGEKPGFQQKTPVFNRKTCFFTENPDFQAEIKLHADLYPFALP